MSSLLAECFVDRFRTIYSEALGACFAVYGLSHLVAEDFSVYIEKEKEAQRKVHLIEIPEAKNIESILYTWPERGVTKFPDSNIWQDDQTLKAIVLHLCVSLRHQGFIEYIEAHFGKQGAR